MRKLTPTSLSARRSRASSCACRWRRQSSTAPERLSITESAPNPIRATLPASSPAPMPIAASATLQPSERYSSLRPRRVSAARLSVLAQVLEEQSLMVVRLAR